MVIPEGCVGVCVRDLVVSVDPLVVLSSPSDVLTLQLFQTMSRAHKKDIFFVVVHGSY